MMVKAVLFDMFETLISHYNCPVYFGKEMAADAGIPAENLIPRWRAMEADRSIGKLTFEDTIRIILEENSCDQIEEKLRMIVRKRVATKEECLRHMDPQIRPMLEGLRRRGIKVGLISNCFSEEAMVIRRSVLFPYFDAVCLSYEEGVQKPDELIYRRCMEKLSVSPEECIYVGDGGSDELVTAKQLGMRAMQAVWYLKEGTMQPTTRMEGYEQLEQPLDLLQIASGIPASVFIASSADVIGNLEVGENAGIWYHATVRADSDHITIGKGTNVQDNCVLHVDAGHPLTIGDYVTIGHGAIVHGCSVGDGTLIGMGAILLNDCKIGKNCIIGAGALVTGGVEIPNDSVVLGNPGKIHRSIRPEEIERNRENAQYYIEEAKKMIDY